MSPTKEEKNTTSQQTQNKKAAVIKPDEKPQQDNTTACPPAPEPRKRKTVSFFLPNLTSLNAPTALVTPPMPTKRRRLDIPSPSPIPVASSSSSTPSYQALYGDDQAGLQSIIAPDLYQRRETYKRRNSVTKFSLQGAHRITLLEAAKKTLEKLRQESIKKEDSSERQRRNHVMRSLFTQS